MLVCRVIKYCSVFSVTQHPVCASGTRYAQTLSRTSILTRCHARYTQTLSRTLYSRAITQLYSRAVTHSILKRQTLSFREFNLRWIAPSPSRFRWMQLISRMSLTSTRCFVSWRRDAWCKRFTSVQACSLRPTFCIMVWQLQFTLILHHQSEGLFCSKAP